MLIVVGKTNIFISEVRSEDNITEDYLSEVKTQLELELKQVKLKDKIVFLKISSNKLVNIICEHKLILGVKTLAVYDNVSRKYFVKFSRELSIGLIISHGSIY